MKTKPKLRARKMWANYHAEGYVCLYSIKSRCMNSAAEHIAVPVAVVPLDDVGGMMQRASYVVDNLICTATIGDIVHAVLVSSGVLPRTRKGGAK